jgi:hypothetical protein
MKQWFLDFYDEYRELLIIYGIIFSLVGILCSFGYVSGCKQANVINNSHGTSYTCGDMFWAGETIIMVLEGTKHNVSVTQEVSQ